MKALKENSLLKKIKHPEGRRLEFKETVPRSEELAKTVIAFSNDAGGEIFIGIQNEPRKIIGVPEEQLFLIEERIANIIADLCEPTILPELSFVTIQNKTVIRIRIFRGSQVPYYLKPAGKKNGTYIRVGSSNRLASQEIIQELELIRRNISFDSLPVRELKIEDIDISVFLQRFEERTGERLNENGLKKLELIYESAGQKYPTNALLLLCNSQHKQEYFPYAKIECARFKGTEPKEFLDQMSIDSPVMLQPEEVMRFIQRNIAKGSVLKGVYREDRWEYPLIAIREAVINAIIHRDYSLVGRDIKVAIYDDMLEITSPGTLPPSIDIGELTSGQSEIRNRVLAPIFKKLGLIEQWGTGFRKIMDALQNYPEVTLQVKEPGMAFQLQFRKESSSFQQAPSIYSASTQHLPRKLPLSDQQVKNLLNFCKDPKTRKEIQKYLNLKDREYFRKSILNPMIETGLLKRLFPGSPKSPKQKYVITEKGKSFLKT